MIRIFVRIAIAWGLAAGAASSATAQTRDEYVVKIQQLLAASGYDTVVVEFDAAPVLLNRDQMLDGLQEHYPEDLKDQGIGGNIETLLRVDSNGTIGDVLILTSSGESALDQAASRVAADMVYSPALRADVPVQVWVSIWLTFEVK